MPSEDPPTILGTTQMAQVLAQGGSWTSGEEGNGASGDNGVPGIIPMECLDLLTGL